MIKLIRSFLILLITISAVAFMSACGDDEVHKHTIIHFDEVSASCTVDGSVEHYACSGCGKKYSDPEAQNEINDITVPKSHVGGEEIRGAVAPTEDGEGYTGDTHCLGCGEKLSDGEPIPKLPHTHTLTYRERVESTCDKDGNVEYYHCLGCDKMFSDSSAMNELSDVIIPKFHSGGIEIKGAKTPTEEQEGYTGDVFCLGCGDKLSAGSVLTRLDHTHLMKKTEAKAPTCKEEGNTEYYVCLLCAKIYSDSN